MPGVPRVSCGGLGGLSGNAHRGGSVESAAELPGLLDVSLLSSAVSVACLPPLPCAKSMGPEASPDPATVLGRVGCMPGKNSLLPHEELESCRPGPGPFPVPSRQAEDCAGAAPWGGLRGSQVHIDGGPLAVLSTGREGGVALAPLARPVSCSPVAPPAQVPPRIGLAAVCAAPSVEDAAVCCAYSAVSLASVLTPVVGACSGVLPVAGACDGDGRRRRLRKERGPDHEVSSSRPRISGPRPRRALIVFSGPLGRPDGLGAELRSLGYEVVEVDRADGGDAHDVRRDVVLARLLAEVRSGAFGAVFLGVPCSTYSVARIPSDGVPDDGPPQVRDCDFLLGIPGLEDGWQREVRAANDVTSRSMAIASAAVAANASVIIENPVSRGVGSPWYEPRYARHASLWDMPCVTSWREACGARSVDCAQCAFGGEYMKLTTFLYTSDLHAAMSAMEAAVCSHRGEAHAAVAHGVDSSGRYVSARAAAYPAALNRALARALAFPHCPSFPLGTSCSEAEVGVVPLANPSDPFLGPEGLRAGSAKPHAALGEEGEARQLRPVPSANPRRLEPELESALRREALPVVNVPPCTAWAEAPAPLPSPLPGPLHTHDLIPQPMQQRLREFRISVRACFEAAKRGRWRWARDHRPKPLHAGEEECLLPVGRGFVWQQSAEDGLWRPLRPSRWPSEPPDCELELAVIVDEAVSMGFPDLEIISFMAHGYPGPEMSREAVLGPPHVGALKNPEGFEKCAAKDRDKGWVRWGSSLPQVWPMRADPMNVVLRFGKARMTIDKTMELIEGLASYNQLIDLESQPEIEYVRVGQLGRAAAILLTAGVEVKLFSFDLEAYFRKTGKQRSSWWMSGFVHADGYGYDPRIQFGQREAPVLCGRQSCFLVWVMRRELLRLEAEYPSRATSVLAWIADRLRHVTEGSEADISCLFFLLMFVDDVGGACVDDLLYDRQGRPIWVFVEGLAMHQRRATLYYHAAIGVVRHYGHSDAVGKGAPPTLRMDFLGLSLDLVARLVSLTTAKVDSYSELLLSVVEGRAGVSSDGRVFAEFDLFNSLVHKLLHACAAVVLGRQHLFHCLRALRSSIQLRAGRMVPVTEAVVRELRWWEAALLACSALEVGVPLAYRQSFPDASAHGVMVPYSDASRELASPESSGFGAWAIVGGKVLYVHGLWEPWELAQLSINVLELAAMQFGTFTFLEWAASHGCPISHVMEFTDNTAAEHSAERGKPHTERLSALVRERYHRLVELGVHSSVERVASVDNDVADGLSRGGAKLADALRIVASSGYPLVRLTIGGRVRSLAHLRPML